MRQTVMRGFLEALKGQRSTSQMTAFLVDGKLITDKKQIREMWADHFEALGTPSVSVRYDNDFLTHVKLQLQGTIYRPDSFVLMLRYCVNLKAIRYESTSLNRIVADKSHLVTVALLPASKISLTLSCRPFQSFAMLEGGGGGGGSEARMPKLKVNINRLK